MLRWRKDYNFGRFDSETGVQVVNESRAGAVRDYDLSSLEHNSS